MKSQPLVPRLYPGLGGAIAKTVDAVLDVFAPRMVLQRRKARGKSAALLYFEAARRDRTRRRVEGSSADAEILKDLWEVRRNARALVRDDAYASSAIRVLEDNIVGSGIRVQAAARPERTGLTPEQAAEWNTSCEELFASWAENWADASEQASFYDLQRKTVRLMLVEGEAIHHRVVVAGVPGRRIETAIEFVDPDRLQNPKNLRDAFVFRDGVEIGKRGQPIRYYITPYHPDDAHLRSSAKNEPVAVARFRNGFANVTHVFRTDRPGQTRGISALAPALVEFEHLHHYRESEMIAARANANVAMFVERPISEEDPDISPVIQALGVDEATSSEKVYHELLEAGTIEYLNEGEKINGFLPTRPNSAFAPFTESVLRGIASTLGVSYELVAKDFARMNYSSARVVLLECRRGFDCFRAQHVIAQFSMPWYRNVIQEGILTGELRKPRGFDRNPGAFLEARWVPPSWGWVDPVKEITAASLAIEKNLSTPQMEAARNGLEAEEILRSRARFLRAAADIEEEFELPAGSLSGVGASAESVDDSDPSNGAPEDGEETPGEDRSDEGSE